MTSLDSIEGVGPAYAEELSESGFESAEDVAQADPAEVDEVLESASGKELVENALDLVDDDSKQEMTVEDETFEVDPDFSNGQINHLISAVVQEEIRARKTNKKDQVEKAMNIIEQLKDGTPYYFTLNQLNTIHRAVNQMESEYRSTRGLGEFVGTIREMKNYFQKKREENWPGANE